MARSPILAAALSLAVAGAATAKPLTVGFYLPWDAASTASLTAHAAALDIVAPMSGALDTPQGHVRWQPDPARAAALAAAHNRSKVFPIVSNAHDQVWDTAAADGALLDTAATDAFIATLAAEAKAQGYGGYILDFENLSPKAQGAYASVLGRLRAVLAADGREVWATTPLTADPAQIRALAAATDTVVLMAYDQCWATGPAGPIAGEDWLEAGVDAVVGPAPGVDPGHVVVALGAYGYDWPKGAAAAVLSAPDALALASHTGQTVARSAPDANPHISYRAADGVAHQAWWLDAQTYKVQRSAALARHARGVAIWRLGLEDPALWSVRGKAPILGLATPPPPCNAAPPKP